MRYIILWKDDKPFIRKFSDLGGFNTVEEAKEHVRINCRHGINNHMEAIQRRMKSIKGFQKELKMMDEELPEWKETCDTI